jgi:hypothetical protein
MAEPQAPREPQSELQALQALQERLDRAAEAAERLLGEATRAAGPSTPPPRGWQLRGAGADDAGAFGGWIDRGDAELLLAALGAIRERIPPELQRRLAVALHELLLALRALLDWCVERVQRRRAAPPEVQDIPIL